MSTRLYRFLVLLLVVVPFLCTILAIYLLWNKYVFPSDIVLMAVFVLLTGLGLTVGYHRMLTHEGFKTSIPIKALLLIFGCMGFEGGPIGWAGRHIQHHAHSDEEGDPHSPLEGFWHAHMGWMFSVSDSFALKKYVPHLPRDPVIAFVDRYTVLWMALSLLLPALIGGWTGLLWGGAVRLFITTHTTFSVNSICHCFGKRPFETADESRNNWLIGLVGFGEGWHNNHHAFPRNAFHGMGWRQFDLSGLAIRALESLGLVWDVQRVSPEVIASQKARAGASHHHLLQLRSQLSAAIALGRQELMRLLESARTPPMSEPQLMEALTCCERAVERLNLIQENIARAAHLKKQRLQLYLREVQILVRQARDMMKPVCSVSSVE